MTNWILNSKGEMIIIRMGGENKGTYLKAGNKLIRELNKKDAGSKTVTISIGASGSGNSETDVNSRNAINGIGSDANVNFDPSANPLIDTKDPVTGNVSGQTRPDEVGLSHELIHAKRSMDGKPTDYSITDHHTYNRKEYKYFE